MMLVMTMFHLAFHSYVLLHSSTPNVYAPSVPGCARLCVSKCVSFFYNKHGDKCVLSDVVYHERDSALKSEADWDYFQLTNKTHDPPCPSKYRHIAQVNMCIRVLVKPKLNYDDATTSCARDGGHLIHLNTNAKIAAWDTIHRLEYAGRTFLLGLNKLGRNAGDFRWTDGSPVTDSKWGPGQPDNSPGDDCVRTEAWGGEKLYVVRLVLFRQKILHL